ncbi:MAG: hypothetical protein KF736_10610 [Acidobacteria bacterium]|nr:hypothetical protein [Acidobacteriota bacterium]MCW5949574.1 hypothetical protein [Pyrinomonadaceae bacterium]
MASMENFRPPEVINRWRVLSLGIGGVAFLIWAVGSYLNTEQALRSWLLGFIFWGGIGIGCLGVLILQYVTGGAWGLVIRRAVEAGSRTLPLIALMFVPLAIGVYTHSVYEFTHLPADDPVVIHRGVYMAPWFWIVRSVIYFAVFMFIAAMLNRWSLEQDNAKDEKTAFDLLGRSTAFSGPMMVVFALTVTFAVVDWVMMLDPHWFSTIWGLLFVAGWGLSCFCFVVALMAFLMDSAPMNAVLGKRHFHDLGKLMLALVMVWAYFNFSQFLIIWSGNLPEETTWFLTRMKGAWGWMGVILILFHFAFPFLVLLQQDFKRRAKWLAGIAIFVLFMRLVDMFYQIGPTPRVDPRGIEAGAFYVSWMDIVAPIAIGGLWLAYFFGQLMKRPLMPINDPNLQRSIDHGRGH